MIGMVKRAGSWQEVLFSDESRFILSHVDGRIRVWRRTGERYVACCMQEVGRWGGGSVMVWARVSYRYKTALHFFDRSLNALEDVTRAIGDTLTK
jgi:hypothetical protein